MPPDVQLRIVDGRHVYTVATGNGETNRFSVPSKYVKSDGSFDYAGIAASFTTQRDGWNTLYKIFDGPKSYYESFKKDLGLDFGKYTQAGFAADYNRGQYGAHVSSGEYEDRKGRPTGETWSSMSPSITKLDEHGVRALMQNITATNGWPHGLEFLPKKPEQTGAQLWAVQQKKIDDANALRATEEQARQAQRLKEAQRREQQIKRDTNLQHSGQPPVEPTSQNHQALVGMMTKAQQGNPWKPTKTDLKLVDAFGPATTAAVLMARHKTLVDGDKVTLRDLRDKVFVDQMFYDRGVDLSRQDAATVAARLSPENVRKKLGAVGSRPDATADELYKAAEAAPDAAAPAVRAAPGPKTPAGPKPPR